MPWRVNTLTEFKAAEGSCLEVASHPTASKGLGICTEKQVVDFGTMDLFCDGVPGNDNFRGEGAGPEMEGLRTPPSSPNSFDVQLVAGDIEALDLGASQVPRGPVLSEASFEQFLTQAYLNTRGPVTVKMLWERGVFKQIFKKPLSDLQHVFQQPRVWVSQSLDHDVEKLNELQGQADERPELVGGFFERALTAVSDVSFQQQRANLLETAVEKWHCVIRVNMLASSTGRAIINCGNIDEQKRAAFETIEAVIGIRSRTTAITRANSFLKFLRWRAELSDNDGKPISEQEAWLYLRELRDNGAAPTKGSSFLSACAYAYHVFGFNHLEGICNSRRLKGLADLMMHAVKAPLRQALVLTVRQVLMLHELLESSDCNVVDRAVAAYLLVALYGRCRHSDLQNIEDALLDLGPEGGYFFCSNASIALARSLCKCLLAIRITAGGADTVEGFLCS